MITQTLYMNIYSGFTYNLPKNLGWETTQMFFSRGMDKHAGTHPYNGIWHINLKKWTFDTHNNNDDSQTHFAEWKRLDSKVIDRLIPFMWHSGEGVIWAQESVISRVVGEKRGDHRSETGGIWRDESFLTVEVVMTPHVEILREFSPKSELYCV